MVWGGAGAQGSFGAEGEYGVVERLRAEQGKRDRADRILSRDHSMSGGLEK